MRLPLPAASYKHPAGKGGKIEESKGLDNVTIVNQSDRKLLIGLFPTKFVCSVAKLAEKPYVCQQHVGHLRARFRVQTAVLEWNLSENGKKF